MKNRCPSTWRLIRELERQGIVVKNPSKLPSNPTELLPKSLDPSESDEIELMVHAYDTGLKASMKGTIRDPDVSAACKPTPPPSNPDAQTGTDGTQDACAGSQSNSDASPANSTSTSSSGSSSSGGLGGVNPASLMPMPAGFAGLQALAGMSGQAMDEKRMLYLKNLTEMINVCEVSLRRVIAMAKRLTAFKQLQQVRLHLTATSSISEASYFIIWIKIYNRRIFLVGIFCFGINQSSLENCNIHASNILTFFNWKLGITT